MESAVMKSNTLNHAVDPAPPPAGTTPTGGESFGVPMHLWERVLRALRYGAELDGVGLRADGDGFVAGCKELLADIESEVR